MSRQQGEVSRAMCLGTGVGRKTGLSAEGLGLSEEAIDEVQVKADIKFIDIESRTGVAKSLQGGGWRWGQRYEYLLFDMH